MTRRQSNNQWSGGIAAHPAPRNSDCKNPLERFWPRFFGIKRASTSLIIFQRAKLSTLTITHLCFCNWRTFWRKNAARSSRGSCFCMTMPRLTVLLQPRRNWPTWTSIVLITHLVLRIWLRRTTPVPWTEKKIESSTFFFWRRSRCCRGDLFGRTTFWFFFMWLVKVRATGWEVHWATWGVCWINPEFGRCNLFPSW